MTTNLRDRVYDALTSDPTLIALGLTTDTLYPAGTDTIQAETFAVMRWGVTEVGPGLQPGWQLHSHHRDTPGGAQRPAGTGRDSDQSGLDHWAELERRQHGSVR
jgi:hypothetical protein